MDDSNFPPNSDASKNRQNFEANFPGEKDIKRITSSDAVRRKRPIRKQFLETFIVGDFKSSVQFVVLDVLRPAIQDLLVESVHQGFEKLMFGLNGSRRRGATPPQTGPMGHINYNRQPMSNRFTAPQRVLNRQARAQHNFDEIILETRVEAEAVIDRLFDLVRQYDFATVADLYELVGFSSAHTDHTWGWENLAGSGVSRARGGYLLDLPSPQPLNRTG